MSFLYEIKLVFLSDDLTVDVAIMNPWNPLGITRKRFLAPYRFNNLSTSSWELSFKVNPELKRISIGSAIFPVTT
eukprot:CAMPEP_0184051812 /NCGR_PEP_ID=MMETSP0956-20121227/4904_1 /TAXON_ID=627963 /ORGANISM="Aplanochytrium sp, Strain PBS07" /LENGTH=74 /DNA_ID=CAMNT_0026344717 /DNA_START=96 /DNA_END=320 /DNA_ORIENTATION=-